MKLSILEALNISATGFIVVLIILALLACIIVVLSKLVRTVEKVANKKSGKDLKQSDAVKNETVSDAAPAAPSASAPTGMVELYKTGEKTAATIMAIVSHESGIPLNRLDFKSIKLKEDLELYKTDDKTAAAIMAIVSNQTGIPLNKLAFKSIKLIEK